jgi:hypothetical protein
MEVFQRCPVFSQRLFNGDLLITLRLDGSFSAVV